MSIAVERVIGPDVLAPITGLLSYLMLNGVLIAVSPSVDAVSV